MVKLKLFTIASVVALSLTAFTGTYASNMGEDSPSDVRVLVLLSSLPTSPSDRISHLLSSHPILAGDLKGSLAQYGASDDEVAALRRVEEEAFTNSMGKDSSSGASWPEPITNLLGLYTFLVQANKEYVLPHMDDEDPEAFARVSSSPTKPSGAPWPPSVAHLHAQYKLREAICAAQIAMTEEAPTEAWLELKRAQRESAAICAQYTKDTFFHT